MWKSGLGLQDTAVRHELTARYTHRARSGSPPDGAARPLFAPYPSPLFRRRSKSRSHTEGRVPDSRTHRSVSDLAHRSRFRGPARPPGARQATCEALFERGEADEFKHPDALCFHCARRLARTGCPTSPASTHSGSRLSRRRGALWREGKGAAIVYQQRGKHLRRAPLRVRDACRLILRQAVTAGSALSSTNGMDGGRHFTLRLAQPRIPRPAAVHPPSPKTGLCGTLRSVIFLQQSPPRRRKPRTTDLPRGHHPRASAPDAWGPRCSRRPGSHTHGPGVGPPAAPSAQRPSIPSGLCHSSRTAARILRVHYRYRWAQHTRNAPRLDSILVTDQLTPVLLVTGQLRLVFNMAEISPALCADDGRTHW